MKRYHSESDDISDSQAKQVASIETVNIEKKKESSSEDLEVNTHKSNASDEPSGFGGSQVGILLGQFLLQKYSHLQHQVLLSFNHSDSATSENLRVTTYPTSAKLSTLMLVALLGETLRDASFST